MSHTNLYNTYRYHFLCLLFARGTLVAAPVSWIIVTRYFSGFAYHHALSWWVFALALVAVLAVTVTIVTLRSLHAASSNPVEHLKEE